MEEDLFGSDIEEGDLFGSDEEEPEPPSAPAAARSVGGRSAAARSGGGRSGGGMGASPMPTAGDEEDERDLFGSEEEDESGVGSMRGAPTPTGVPARVAPGSRAGVPVTPARSVAGSEPSLFSEMNEKDIFGDLSDDEGDEADAGKREEVVLLKRPAPPENRRIEPLRLPNVLSIETHAFRRDRIPPKLLQGYRDIKTMQDKQIVQLLSPENCIRWRFKKDKDGQILTDEEGRPQYESNSRIVEWEDGTTTLFVGDEAYKMSRIKDKVLLFEENSPEVHVCQGVMESRLIATPTNLETAAHKLLKRSQFQKIEPVRRSLLQSAQEQEAQLAMEALESEQRKRQQKRSAASLEQDVGGLTGAFIESGAGEDGGVGESVLALAQQAKRGKVR